jgi:hypothetical protein
VGNGQLLEEEREQLMNWSRGRVLAASPVARAKAILAVADGRSYTDAAREAGRRSGDAVATLVGRFNVEGLAAVVLRHGGGHPRHSSVSGEIESNSIFNYPLSTRSCRLFETDAIVSSGL